MSSEGDEPTRKELDNTVARIVEPADGPKEIVDAAEQESEIPEDETDEG